MKINELLKKRPTLSFEIFPPKNNENDITSIYATIDELAKMNPDFISVTYGANGSTSKNTCKIASTIKNKYGIESVAHLTCMNNTKDEIKNCFPIDYIHVLKMNQKGQKYLKTIKKTCDYHLITTLSSYTHPALDLEIKSSKLLSLIDNQIIKKEFQNIPVIELSKR